MTVLVAPRYVWLDGRLQEGLAIELAGGAVARVRPLQPTETADLTPYLAMPACTDLQVNGSGGTMLNSDPTPAGISKIVATQRTLGTGWVMPTLITTTDERMNEAADAALDTWGHPGFMGLHFEGPHLNPSRKGTHDQTLFRPFGETTTDVLYRLRRRGIPVMLTLAPELMAPSDIRAVVDLGVVVSAGHTAATAEETRSALAQGVSCFTHLFNAMPPMLSRDPGVAAAAINSEAYIGFIADGHHVSWDMIAIACRARPLPNRMFLVSDAMATIAGPDHFTLYDERIEVRNGALVNAAGSLAGAHIDMLTSLRNIASIVAIPLCEAIGMATSNPRTVMGLPSPSIIPGTRLEEIVLLDEDLSFICTLPRNSFTMYPH